MRYLIILAEEIYAPWLIPYAYGIIVFGFLFFLFRVFESWYAGYYNRPLYRNLFIYKKLATTQVQILETEFSFYSSLSKTHQKQFEHRVAHFIDTKNFVGRGQLIISERMKILVAASACMLSFGRKNYVYHLVQNILIYPESFYSNVNNNFHNGEFNPKEKALVISWKAFENGYQITNDNLNLGIHEFMHAMQLEAKAGTDLDAARFNKRFQDILKLLATSEIKDKLIETRYFREYAYTNQYEFIAVLAEYFIESPTDFKKKFPTLYLYMRQLLNFNFKGY